MKKLQGAIFWRGPTSKRFKSKAAALRFANQLRRELNLKLTEAKRSR